MRGVGCMRRYRCGVIEARSHGDAVCTRRLRTPIQTRLPRIQSSSQHLVISPRLVQFNRAPSPAPPTLSIAILALSAGVRWLPLCSFSCRCRCRILLYSLDNPNRRDVVNEG